RYALVEKKNYDCIFLKDKKCSVYPVRPTQCRTFPWWMQNLATPEDWKEAAKFCEGISDDAPLVSIDIIESQLNLDKTDV
ncbi:MAG TPA: YkgJ family cysteine cluster protein, partial [Parachlamydiaceae bacterium]|nr:YkgJ family cysteine cluster protein [Parachlamydiaceae bacterium]